MTDKKLQIRNSTAEFLVFTAQSGRQSIEVRYEDRSWGWTEEIPSKILASIFKTFMLKANWIRGQLTETLVSSPGG